MMCVCVYECVCLPAGLYEYQYGYNTNSVMVLNFTLKHTVHAQLVAYFPIGRVKNIKSKDKNVIT